MSKSEALSEEIFNTEDLAQDEDTETNEITEDLEEETENVQEMTEETKEDPTTENVAQKKSSPSQFRLTELPLTKIKSIIKLDPAVALVNREATFLITKSTELFIKALAKQSFEFTTQNKKKTITKENVTSALNQLPVELL